MRSTGSNPRRSVVLWMCLGLLGPTQVLAQSMTFSAAADTRVDQVQPKTNFGGAYLATRGGIFKEQTLLRFQVTGLTGPVISAKLRLWATVGTTDGPAVFATASDWLESKVNWTTRPTWSVAENSQGPHQSAVAVTCAALKA